MQKYSSTFAGLILVILGWVGVTGIVTENELVQGIDHLLQFIGVATIWYQRRKRGDVSVLGFRK